MKSPAFQFYPDDFIGGTVGMTAKEVGHYIRLLCYQWGHASLPKEKSALNRIAGGEVSKIVLAKFPKGKNHRLEREREKQLIWREKSRVGGLNSAANRAKGGSTTLQPPCQPNVKRPVEVCLQPKGNTPSPSPSPTIKTPQSFRQASQNGFSKIQTELVTRFDLLLDTEWENDRQKWMGRIKNSFNKSERVWAEVHNAKNEGRIKTSPARYAEQTWKEFL